MTFEEASLELDKIISKLSSNKTTLSEAKELFDRGLELSKFCSKELEDIKGKVTIIKEELNTLVEEEDENF